MSAAMVKRERQPEPTGVGAPPVAPVTLAELAATINAIAAEYPTDANAQLAQAQVAALQGVPGPGVWVKGPAALAIAGGAAALGGVAGFAIRAAMKPKRLKKRTT
jgi:hypothetical protein